MAKRRVEDILYHESFKNKCQNKNKIWCNLENNKIRC